jgi:hypothetical protein
MSSPPLAPSETAPGIIAAQLHRQGVACTTPRGAEPDAENSTPHETAWVLRCDEASYRVTLIPHLRAHITSICRQDRSENASSTTAIAGKQSLANYDLITPGGAMIADQLDAGIETRRPCQMLRALYFKEGMRFWFDCSA